MIMNVSSSL